MRFSQRQIFSNHRNTSSAMWFVLVITESKNFLKREGYFPMIATYFRNTLHDTILLLKLDADFHPSVDGQPSPHFSLNKNINNISYFKSSLNFFYHHSKTSQGFDPKASSTTKAPRPFPLLRLHMGMSLVSSSPDFFPCKPDLHTLFPLKCLPFNILLGRQINQRAVAAPVLWLLGGIGKTAEGTESEGLDLNHSSFIYFLCDLETVTLCPGP